MNTISEHIAVKTAQDRLRQVRDLLADVYADGVAAGRLLQKIDDDKEIAYLQSTLESVLESKLEEQP